MTGADGVIPMRGRDRPKATSPTADDRPAHRRKADPKAGLLPAPLEGQTVDLFGGRVVNVAGGQADPPDGPAAEPGEGVTALETTGLGKRYGSNLALRECSLTIPAGRVVALVGPNGAGKTTLLHLVAGLLAPTEGSVRIFGRPARHDRRARTPVAFMSQDKPLYEGFSVAETLRFGRLLNLRWDDDLARRRIDDLGIPLKRKVGKLSGGQRTQVALTLALARRPRLLLLDEPLADLDPLARHEVMRTLMEAVAETGLTVLFSSHVVSDLEGTCDWLVVVNRGRLQISGDIEELLSGHRILTGPAEEADAVDTRTRAIARDGTGRQATLLVREGRPLLGPKWTVHPVNFHELVLAYLRDPDAAALPGPAVAQ